MATRSGSYKLIILDEPTTEDTLVFAEVEDQSDYFAYELESARITSYSVSGAGSDSDEPPVDTIALNFGKIEYEFALEDSFLL